MVLGFSGWMDGGDVSTGTIECLAEKLAAQELAEIDPAEFYLYNFPGSMEISSLFRPHAKIEDGIITEYLEPTNRFLCNEEHNLILFQGKEPNLRWKQFADCVFSLCSEFNVNRIWFVGSVAGIVPHTKDPRFFASLSEEALIPTLEQYDLLPSDYEGPASFITYLMMRAKAEGVRMGTLVAEIPAYIQGRNIKCIEATTRKLAGMLGVSLDLEDLRILSAQFEKRLRKAVRDRPELADVIRKMEKDYDKKESDSQMSEIKAWFERQDIRLN